MIDMISILYDAYNKKIYIFIILYDAYNKKIHTYIILYDAYNNILVHMIYCNAIINGINKTSLLCVTL